MCTLNYATVRPFQDSNNRQIIVSLQKLIREIIWKILPGWLREAVDDPDEVFKRIILFPLLECEVQHKVVIMFVDGLDLDVIIPGSAATGQTLIINQIISINY